MALFDLLDGLEDMLISSLSITSALMDGLLTLAGDLVSFLFDGSSGILMQPLDIPILSDLYSLLFGGSQLTFFDLVLLVASIPVTFLYRVIEGTWFADEELSGVQAPPPPIRRGTGMLNAILFFGRSFLMPINDAISQGGQPNKILGYTMQSISGLFALSTLLKLAQVSDALFVGTALILIFPSYFGELAPAVSAFLALLRIGGFIFNMVTEAPPDALLVLSGNLLGSLPPLSQPLKYLNTVTEDLSLVLLVAIDTFANMGAGAVTFIQTIKTWDASPTAEPPVPEPDGPSKLYMPYAAAG